MAAAAGVHAAALATAAQAADAMANAAASAAGGGVVPVDPSNYVPSPMEPGWQVWFGAVVGVIPFVIGAYEFTKRIVSMGAEADGGGQL